VLLTELWATDDTVKALCTGENTAFGGEPLTSKFGRFCNITSGVNRDFYSFSSSLAIGSSCYSAASINSSSELY
jgi:hypothetical protein